jgi:hypothetical protein
MSTLHRHDHESTSDWKLMTDREETVLTSFMSLPSWLHRNDNAGVVVVETNRYK